ncbi:hypothetical protein ACLB1O_10980 [Escherichia coli]
MIFPFVDYFRNSLVVSGGFIRGGGFPLYLGLTRFPACALKVGMTINASFYTVYMFSGILPGGAAFQNHHRAWHLRH